MVNSDFSCKYINPKRHNYLSICFEHLHGFMSAEFSSYISSLQPFFEGQGITDYSTENNNIINILRHIPFEIKDF